MMFKITITRALKFSNRNTSLHGMGGVAGDDSTDDADDDCDDSDNNADDHEQFP